jgi:hypothetical protein
MTDELEDGEVAARPPVGRGDNRGELAAGPATQAVEDNKTIASNSRCMSPSSDG